MNILAECVKVFDIEISQLQAVRDSLDESIVNIVHEIHNCQGKVILCGMGKAGHVARKIAATLSSLGISSFFLHPAEALHGDLGSLSKKDVILLISNSGNSKEIVKLFPSLQFIGIKTIAITSNPKSELAIYSDLTLLMPKMQEACSLNLAPTSSTTAELVIGDALAVVVSMMQNLKSEQYAIFHPEGALGNKLLTKVSDLMKTGEAIPVIVKGSLVKDAIVEISQKGFGAVIILDKHNKMCGIVTDGDFRRALEKNIDIYASIVDEIMTLAPLFTTKNSLAVDALRIMEQDRLISVLPVIDEDGIPEGIINNHEIIRSGIIL